MTTETLNVLFIIIVSIYLAFKCLEVAEMAPNGDRGTRIVFNLLAYACFGAMGGGITFLLS